MEKQATIDDCIRETLRGIRINSELRRTATSNFLIRHAQSQIAADMNLLKGLQEIKKMRNNKKPN